MVNVGFKIMFMIESSLIRNNHKLKAGIIYVYRALTIAKTERPKTERPNTERPNTSKFHAVTFTICL
jgi:hypothetical protein